MRWVRLLVVLFLLSLTACYRYGAREDQLKNRASFDLNCPANQLLISKIDDRTRGVRGCGKQGAYVENCDRHNDNCTWVLNTTAK